MIPANNFFALISTTFPLMLGALAIAAVVLLIILLYRISKSLEEIASSQKELTEVVSSFTETTRGTIGNTHEQR